MSRVPVLAIGRSGLLYDTLVALGASERYRVAAVISDAAYAEYDVSEDDFAELAEGLGAEFLTARTVSADLVGGLASRHDVQIGISVNWRFLIPADALLALPYGILNLHLGRLPDYKGNATANWAIVQGEAEICADVHRMVPDLDAGDVLARATLPLGPETYVGDVLAWSRGVAPELFRAGLDRAIDDPDAAVVRGSTSGLRCYPRLPEDGVVEWTQPAEQVSRLVRASSRPYPGARTVVSSASGQRPMRIWRAHRVRYDELFLAAPGQVLAIDRETGTVDVACGVDVLRLDEVELEAGPQRPADAIRSVRARLRAPNPSLEVVLS